MKGEDYQNFFFFKCLGTFFKGDWWCLFKLNTDTFKTWKSGQSHINQSSTLPDNAAYKE